MNHSKESKDSGSMEWKNQEDSRAFSVIVGF